MKSIQQHITERLVLNKDRVQKAEKKKCIYFPKTTDELKKIIKELAEKHTDPKQVFDLNIIDTSEITNMYSVFADDARIIMKHALRNVHKIDISQWDVSHVEKMGMMFYNTSFRSIGDVSQWDVSNVTNMGHMFAENRYLKQVDLSNWETKSLDFVDGMFIDCKMLTNIGDLDNWDMSRVDSFSNMFRGCKKLTNIGDISRWNISNVKTMYGMFWDCENLKQCGDIEKWNVDKTKCKITSMFYNTSIQQPSWAQ
jgi:surface protein